MFYSSDFYFADKYSSEFDIHLVSESSEILNEYGISYDASSEEITLSFCYADSYNKALSWDSEILENVLSWLITDNYEEFISEDNEEIVYFLKGESYVKRFTPDMKGIIDVTFKTLSTYGYKKYSKKIVNTGNKFIIFNSSNLNTLYKPIIELKDIASNTITIINTTIGKEPLILNNLSKDIVIDNSMGTIADIDGNNLIMNSNRKWIELVKGNNSMIVEGDCTLIFKAYYPMMV